MRPNAKTHAEGIRASRLAKRRAEADELFHITELAVAYDATSPEDALEVWAEKQRRYGGSGTPLASEFLAMELAGLLECSVMAAAGRLAEVLNLRFRHAPMWEAVQNLELDAGRGLHAAGMCSNLPADVALAVGVEWVEAQWRLGWRAAFNLLEELILCADPAAAAIKESRAKKNRKVRLWPGTDGNAHMDATLDPLDAQLLNSTLDSLADILGDGGVQVTSTKEQLRAKALGILATPALALRLQQQAIQGTLPFQTDTALQPAATSAGVVAGQSRGGCHPTGTGTAVVDAGMPSATSDGPHSNDGAADTVNAGPDCADGVPVAATDWFNLTAEEIEALYAAADAEWDAAHPFVPDTFDEFLHSLPPNSPPTAGPVTGGAAAPAGETCLGHTCGTVTVPADKLLPKVKLVVHIDKAEMDAFNDGDLQGTAWIEHIGTVTLNAVTDLLDGKRVTVQPVIDLNTIPAEDHYRPSTRLTEAIHELFPYETFPYSTRRSRTADLDHTTPFRAGAGPGQTRLSNLAPLTRVTHKAKTLGAWRYTQPTPGTMLWTSPLGYRYEVSTGGTTALN